MRDLLQMGAMSVADWLVAVISQPVPNEQALQLCKIISHRGEHDNVRIVENTLPAFANARAGGVWGVECDIRWTADLVPVIFHDATCRRLFGSTTVLADTSFARLRDELPQIPSLPELIEEFGGNTHLMLELKAEHYPAPDRQKEILKQALAPLAAGRDFHFLALAPELFSKVDFVPRSVCFPVSELNVGRLSRASLEGRWGGLSGHFLLINNALKKRHEAAGQRVGTGFVSSKNCLFRELNRGIEWIFSNDAVKIQKILDRYLSEYPSRPPVSE